MNLYISTDNLRFDEYRSLRSVLRSFGFSGRLSHIDQENIHNECAYLFGENDYLLFSCTDQYRFRFIDFIYEDEEFILYNNFSEFKKSVLDVLGT